MWAELVKELEKGCVNPLEAEPKGVIPQECECTGCERLEGFCRGSMNSGTLMQ
jgi:hypothetical protein